jgi:hypothetical protein
MIEGALMKPVFRSSQFHVYDEVLGNETFSALWSFIQAETFVPVHRDVWQKAWRFADGIPLRSLTSVLYAEAQGARVAAAAASARPPRTYPTHTAVDKLLDVIVGSLDGMSDLVGRRDSDFDGICACAYLYPQGTGLSWHADVPRLYSGAYVFYAHPEWNCQWGGELFLADEASRSQDLGAVTTMALRREGARLTATATQIPPFLDNRQENAELERMGMGRYVAPKPNRLVVIAGGNPHMINRVSPAAGDRVRCSISGFFHRPGT